MGQFNAKFKANRQHASAVPLGLLRDRLSGLQWGSNRQWTWLGSCNGSSLPTHEGSTYFQPLSQARLGKVENSCAGTSSTGSAQPFRGFDEDASPEDEWRELKDALADAPQGHIGKTRRHRRDWVTGETIALAEQARLARVQSAPSRRGLRRQTTRALRRDRNAYWEAIAEETKRVAAACGDTRKLYQMQKSVNRSQAGVGEVLLERDGSVVLGQVRKLCSTPEHRILTTAYLRGGNLHLWSWPAHSGGGVHCHPTAMQ